MEFERAMWFWCTNGVQPHEAAMRMASMFRIALRNLGFVFSALGLSSTIAAHAASAQVRAKGRAVPAQCAAYGKTYNQCEYYVIWDTVGDQKMTHICINGEWQEAQGEPQYWLHFVRCDRRGQ